MPRGRSPGFTGSTPGSGDLLQASTRPERVSESAPSATTSAAPNSAVMCDRRINRRRAWQPRAHRPSGSRFRRGGRGETRPRGCSRRPGACPIAPDTPPRIAEVLTVVDRLAMKRAHHQRIGSRPPIAYAASRSIRELLTRPTVQLEMRAAERKAVQRRRLDLAESSRLVGRFASQEASACSWKQVCRGRG